MVGSTLQVRTRTHDSPWQENVELKALSEPDYSSIPQVHNKPPPPQQVTLVVSESKGSIPSTVSSQEKIVFSGPRSLRRDIKLFFRGFMLAVGIDADMRVTWSCAFLLASLYAALYWAVAWGSLYFIISDFASVWPPNGVFVGGLIRATPRTRRLMVILTPIAIFTVNVAWGNTAFVALGFLVLNTIECLLVTGISLGLVLIVLPKKLSLLHRKHLICIGLGILIGCLISGNFGTAFSVWRLNPNRSYGATYLKYIGRNVVGCALIVPVILSFPLPPRARDIPNVCLQYICTKPRKVMQMALLAAVLVGTPALSAYVINGSALSAVGGLYITYPVVLYASAKYGLVGASLASMLVGLSSAICTLTFSQNDIYPAFADSNHLLSVQDQFVWMQLFMVVLISTSMFFVVILAERDRARTNIENKVHQRTEELTIALAQLDDALRKAETADNDKAVFFSFLCHELRNPLHVISNMANFLEDNHESDLPQIKAIKSSSKYMLALVSDVLDLGRFEAGRVVLENLTVDIHSLLQSNFDCAAQLAESHHINFDTEIDKHIPKWLSVDSVRLQQILNNLISNAFKFTPKGGRIHVEVRALKVFHGVNPQSAVDLVETSLSVRDRESLSHKHRRGLSIASTTSDDVVSLRSTASSKNVSQNAGGGGTRESRWSKKRKKKQQQQQKEEDDDYFDIRSSTGANSDNISTVSYTTDNFSTNNNNANNRTCNCNTPNCTGHNMPNSGSSGSSSGRTSNNSISLLRSVSSNLISLSSNEGNGANPMRHSGQETIKRSQEMKEGGGSSSSNSRSNDDSNRTRQSSTSSSSGTASVASPLITPSPGPSPAKLTGADGEGAGAGAEGGEEESDWVVVEVSVSDTGIGIDPAIVSKLFRPYAQAAVSTMREYGGSGLGLAITNQIVRLMGGSVYVETEIGKGSKFTFTVPLQIVKDPLNASEPSPPPEMVSPLSPALRHPSPPHEPSPMVNMVPDFSLREDDDLELASEYPVFKVLIVDDSSINRSILISMVNKVLKKGTYSVAIATNGQEAVDMCLKDPEFDLIFMDIVMPVMNGWDACRHIRANGFQKHIVITTANQVTGEAATEIAAAGASDAISKPFSKEHIQKLLQKFGAGYALKT